MTSHPDTEADDVKRLAIILASADLLIDLLNAGELQAAIDRLIHHATIIKLEGGSYRQKQQNSEIMKQRKRPS